MRSARRHDGRRAITRQIRAAMAACAAISVLTVTACNVKKAQEPGLTGPSELGTSITILASPDVLTQDGYSQSQVVIQARNDAGLPIRDLPVRIEINVGGVPVDYGRLSARTLVTGIDGRANVTYTAPPPPLEPVDNFTTVSLWVIPTGTNFANAVARETRIRLVPPGVILPPNTPPEARLSFSSPTRAGEPIQFDGTSSFDPDGAIASYRWDFGDGILGTGPRPTHTYTSSNTYIVTLWVTDNRGAESAPAQTSIGVSAQGTPSAAFSFSPDLPLVDDTVFFNASASQASGGRTIVSYDWNFGDGSTGVGALVTHAFTAIGTYTVQLTVTDDLGQRDIATERVAVDTSAAPTAVFTISPQTPAVGEAVFFDASGSTAAPGRTIVSYTWSLGDGDSASGQFVTESYSATGTYAVSLTVTDDLGKTNTATQTIAVGAGELPIADFVFSPTGPDIGQTVFFDASLSTAPPGRSIASYGWNFGDGSHGNGRTTSHKYNKAGDYAVVLTIKDSDGATGTVSQIVTVGAPTGITADFSVSPDPAATGQPVQFDGSLSTPSQNGNITSYSWNFGDPSSGSNTATAKTATHTFNAEGTYTVTLTIKDSNGQTSKATKTVTVEDP